MAAIATLVLLTAAITLFTAGCLNEGKPLPNNKAPQRTALKRTDPKQVAEAFIRAQTQDDRATINDLMTPQLRQSFAEKGLYLFDKEEVADKEVILNSIKTTAENTEKENGKLYTVNYELTLKDDGLNEQRQVIDLVFVTKNADSGKWYVSTYQHVVYQ